MSADPKKYINTYDLDGVIFMGPNLIGLTPGPDDRIITGRSFEEMGYTMEYLESRGIRNVICFNPARFHEKSREQAGRHKAKVLADLRELGYHVGIHFEDDPVQAAEIRAGAPWVNVVLLQHNLVNKENVWHGSEPAPV